MSIDTAAMNFINQHNQMKIARTNAGLNKYGIDTRAQLQQQNIDLRNKLFDLVQLPESQERMRQATYAQDKLEAGQQAEALGVSTDNLQQTRQKQYKNQLDEIDRAINEMPEDLQFSLMDMFTGKNIGKIPGRLNVRANQLWDSFLKYGRPDAPKDLDPLGSASRYLTSRGFSPLQVNEALKNYVDPRGYVKNQKSEDIIEELKNKNILGTLYQGGE